MEYNETKRGLEKAAGILGVVSSALIIVGFIYMFIIGCINVSYVGQVRNYINSTEFYYTYEHLIDTVALAYIIIALIFIAMSIVKLVFCAKIIKSPVMANGKVKNIQKTRICVVVFAFLTGCWITAGLEIAVLCLKDFIEPVAENNNYIQAPSMKNPNSIDAKVAELKHLKELGVIDEVQYKKAVDKIIAEMM